MRESWIELGMRVTVCELPEERSAFDTRWRDLAVHTHNSASEIVLLPAMSLDHWSTHRRSKKDPLPSAAEHEDWNQNFSQLGAALVLGSTTVEFGNELYDAGFVWDAEHGIRSVHAKVHRAFERFHEVPEELLTDFIPMEVQGVSMAFLLGTELCVEAEAERYGREGVDLLATQPGKSSGPFDEWLLCAKRAAILSGAYAVSSHRAGGVDGHGYIIAPDGEVRVLTSAGQAFVTMDLSLPVSRDDAADAQPHPAPAWLDPLELGVPPYD
jgi:predicted amidohydrolase